MKEKRKYPGFRSMAAVLLAFILMTSFVPTAFAAETTEKSAISLKSADDSTLLPFAVENMFPGDSVTKDVTVNVSHKGEITLHYHADIHPGYEILSEVLKIKVALPDKGTVLYDGLMSNMPSSLSQELSASEKSLTYRLTVYLDTSVGSINEKDTDGKRYMYQSLKADFRWWFLEETSPDKPTDPTDPTDPDKPTDPDNPTEYSSAVVKLTAEKVLDGKFARGNDFTFELKDTAEKLVQSVKNDDGHIEFDTLSYNAAGTYTYFLTEKAGNQEGATYDDALYKITVTVTKGDSAYQAVVTYEKNGEAYTAIPRFHNWSPGVPVDPNPPEPDNPKTGDDSNIMLYSILAGVSLLALILLLLIKRKKEEQQNG